MWWKNKISSAFLLLSIFFKSEFAKSQELFVMTEPASNMPAKAVAMRVTNKFMNGHLHSYAGNDESYFMQRIVPEFAIGLNKKINLRVSGFLANYYQKSIKLEGFNMYVKYRFLSHDDLHRHFRMAAFSRISVIDHAINFREINLEGDNSGLSTGFVATQLLHKLALSATLGYVHTTNNIGNYRPDFVAKNSINYTLSAGYLLLPFHYKNYNQPNLNVYCELQGRNSFSEYEAHIFEVFPALQLILKSYMRIDLGYRYQIKSNVSRNAYSGYLLRFEYNIFNALH